MVTILTGVAIFIMNLFSSKGKLDKYICFISGCLVGVGLCTWILQMKYLY
jgi:hypothetical protein